MRLLNTVAVLGVITFVILLPLSYKEQTRDPNKPTASENQHENSNNDAPNPSLQPDHSARPNSTTEDENCKTNNKIFSKLCVVWHHLSTFESFMVILTLLYVFTAAMQWTAIHRQGCIAQQSVSRLERPWILVRMKAHTNPSYKDGHWYRADGSMLTTQQLNLWHFPIEVEYSIKNHGSSPAWLIYHWMKVAIIDAENGLPKVPNYKAETPSFNGADTRHFEPRRSARNWVTIPYGEFKEIQARKKFLYMYGYITYRDVWDKKHKTGFSFYYFVPGPYDPNLPDFYPEPAKYNYEK